MVKSTIRAPRAGGDHLAEALARHEGLVRWVVRQQWRGPLSFAEALHEGRLGLWRALQGYDPTRGYRFSSYAVPAIAHAVWAAVAQACPPPLASAAASAVPVAEAVDPVEGLHRAQVGREVQALVAQLPPRLRQVLVAHYGLDGQPPQTFAVLGRAQGVSKQRIHQLHVAALVWLAQPSRSLALRQLLTRDRGVDYQQTRARQRRLARARHGHRGGQS